MANKKKKPKIRNQKSKTDKVLGQDPFEGLVGLNGEEADGKNETAATKPETVAADGQTPEPPTPAEEGELEAAATEADQTTEPAEAVEAKANRESEIGNPKSMEEGGLLDDIIASIDEEIKQTLGPNTMAELDTEMLAEHHSGTEQYVIFTLAGTEYATPIGNVIEIGHPPDVTPVPNVPDWLLGVTNLRGDILSVVDLGAFLGLDRSSVTAPGRLLVVQAGQEAAPMLAGLIVDQVNEIRYLAVEHMGMPTAPIEDQVAPYLRGVYEYNQRLLVVLNFERLLLSPQMQQFEPV